MVTALGTQLKNSCQKRRNQIRKIKRENKYRKMKKEKDQGKEESKEKKVVHFTFTSKTLWTEKTQKISKLKRKTKST